METGLKEWAEPRVGPKVLYRLVKALRRAGNRLVDAVDGGVRQKRLAVQKARQRQAWRETARAQSKANAAALQSDPRFHSQLEELIAARIGRAVGHVGSKAILSSGNGVREHAYRRAYTQHWFEVSGPLDDKLTRLLDANGRLGVFVKSASKLRLCEPLELILSEQGGNGFRAPYYFGSFSLADLKIGAWECVDTGRLVFAECSLGDQTRIVEAIAAANAVRADRIAPVKTRWVNVEPRKFKTKYLSMDGVAHDQWKSVYARTADVLSQCGRLVRRLQSVDEVVLSHNDLRVGGNISVPPVGDVILFDWEIATLSVPGADLGILSRTESGDHLLSCYISRMAQFGFELDPDAVRLALDVIEGLRSVHNGWSNLDTAEVEWGLGLLTRQLR